MKKYNGFKIYDAPEFILSETFNEYTIESRKLIAELLTKINNEKIEFSIKVRKNKEFAITLSYDFGKNILTVWPWENYVQVLIIGEMDKKVNCYSKEDISKELIRKIYKKYCERCKSQIKLDI